MKLQYTWNAYVSLSLPNWRTLHKFELKHCTYLTHFVWVTMPVPSSQCSVPQCPNLLSSSQLCCCRCCCSFANNFCLWRNNLPLRAQHCNTGFSLFTKYRVCVTHKNAAAAVVQVEAEGCHSGVMKGEERDRERVREKDGGDGF